MDARCCIGRVAQSFGKARAIDIGNVLGTFCFERLVRELQCLIQLVNLTCGVCEGAFDCSVPTRVDAGRELCSTSGGTVLGDGSWTIVPRTFCISQAKHRGVELL